MPFTLSHAVVAIPFARSPLPAAGVAAGAMAPDLPLFLPGGIGYPLTHQTPFFPLSGLVIGVVMVVVWRVVLRPWAATLAPSAVASRLPDDWTGSWREGLASPPRRASGVILMLAAIELGVVTHIVWDEFSHVGRLGARLLPVLDADGPLHIAWASWVQYASSALGLAGLLVWAVLWLGRRTPRPLPSVDPRLPAAVWAVVAASTLLGAVVDAVRTVVAEAPRIDVAVAVLTGGIGAGILALVLATLLLDVLRVEPRS